MSWESPLRAWAAIDDDIPGTSLSVGSTVSQSVGVADVSDVYSLELIEGREVHIRCDPGITGSATGTLHLLVPGAASTGAAEDFDELIYTLHAGSPTRSWADYDYVPAKSGTYYLWVSWGSGVLNYSLSVKNTARPMLDLAADSDDVPGTAVGSGIHTGVVSTLADADDVYAVDADRRTDRHLQAHPDNPVCERLPRVRVPEPPRSRHTILGYVSRARLGRSCARRERQESRQAQSR